MTVPLHILMVGDSDRQTELFSRELYKGDYVPVFYRVETRQQLLAALQRQSWDIIFSNYFLSQFSGLEALTVYKETGIETPFIIISDAIGESRVAEIMRGGANDYLLQSDLSDFVPMVTRNIQEAQTRHDHQNTNFALQENEQGLEKRNRFLAKLNNLTQISNQIPGLDCLLRTLSKNVMEWVDADGCYILLEDNLNNKVSAVYASQTATDLLSDFEVQEALNHSHSGLNELIVNSPQVWTAEDLQDTALIAPFILPSAPFQSLLGAAMVSGDKKLGLILFCFNHHRQFTQQDIDDYVRTTEQLSLAISKSQLFDELEARIEERTAQLHQTNAERIQSENKFQGVIEQSRDGLILADQQGIIIEWNQAMEKIFGRDHSIMVGSDIWDFMCELTLKRSSDLSVDPQSNLASDELPQLFEAAWLEGIQEAEFITDDGVQRSIQFSIFPIHLEQGFLIGSTHRDISQYKQLNERLNQAKRLEAIGQLASGIAHEINTPTQFIGDNLRFLQRTFVGILQALKESDNLLTILKHNPLSAQQISSFETELEKVNIEYIQTEIPLAIQETLEGIQRITKIVSAIRNFSRPGINEKISIDINKALEDTLTISRNEWKYVATVETFFDPDLPMITGIAGEINQAFLNIIINAAQAIAVVISPEDKAKTGDLNSSPMGKINISTRQIDDWVEIRIADTGIGIPEIIRSKIFDPFFTTNVPGKGTGQGLSIAYDAIVIKHGGLLSFETELGKGTTFMIRLPIKSSS